jgi:hypothetical protein
MCMIPSRASQLTGVVDGGLLSMLQSGACSCVVMSLQVGTDSHPWYLSTNQ